MGSECFGIAVQTITVLFYEYYVLLVYPWPSWIEEVPDVLTGLFDWVLL